MNALEPAPTQPQPGYGLQLPGVVTATGLVLPEGLSFEEWWQVGAILDHVGGAWQWWYGDWYGYGERHFHGQHAQALAGKDVQSKMNAAWVASRIEISRRREISWSHHAAVAGLEPEEQEALLALAIEREWSERELRVEVRRRRPSKHLLSHRERLGLMDGAMDGRELGRIPEPFWDAVVKADALSYLRDLASMAPGGAADVCVTSPPYWGKRGYSDDPGELGREPEPAAYVERLVEIVDAIGEVLVPGGYLFLNLGETYANQPGGYRGDPFRARGISEAGVEANSTALGGRRLDVPLKSVVGIPWRVLLALVLERGWRCANVICWYKPNHQPENVHDRLTQTWEPILLLTRAAHAYLRRERVEDTGDLWMISTGRHDQEAGHLAPFPDALVERALRLACPGGGIVLDPFAGTGTTLLVANRLGYRFLGCDLAVGSLVS